MNKHLLWLALFCALPFAAFTQNTPEQDLEQGVEKYNAYKAWFEGYSTPDKMTLEDLANGKERLRSAIAQFERVIAKGNADQIRVARYFKMNSLYEQAFLDAFKGKTKEAWTAIKPLKADMEYWSDPAQFPLRYVFFEKNYSIKFENFAPNLMEFYTAYAELNDLNGGPPDESYLYYQKVAKSDKATTWSRYVALDKIVKYETKNDPDLLKLPNSVLAQLYTYYSLEEKSRQTIKDNNYTSPKTLVSSMLNLCKRTPAIARRGALAGETATLVAANSPRDDNDVVQLYQIAVKDGQSLNDALNFALNRQNLNNIETAITPSSVRELAAKLGTDILDQRYTGVLNGSDCAAMETLAAQYQTLGNTSRATELRNKKAKCDAELAKKLRRADNKFNIYAGIYPIPLFGSSDKRDVGGHVDFVFKTVAISFSYVDYQYRADNNLLLLDLDNDYRWDGYRARMAFKFFSKKTPAAYNGFVLGYAEKRHYNDAFNYRDAILSDLNDPATSLPVIYNERFEPLDRQYELMFVTGVQLLGKVIGTDFSLGVGGTVNQFDGGNADYWGNDQYEIADPFLNKRTEFQFFPQIFVNWSIGLNFGKKRL